MLIFSKIWYYSSNRLWRLVNFSIGSWNPTSIQDGGLFDTCSGDPQPLTIIVKISAGFLNLHITTKYYYWHCWLFWQVSGCFFKNLDQYWIDLNQVSYRPLVFIRNLMHQPGAICIEFILEKNNNKLKNYWTVIIFITFFYFFCFLFLNAIVFYWFF